MTLRPSLTMRRREVTALSLAALAVTWGLSADWRSALVAVLGVGAPVAGVWLGCRVSGRGAVAGCVALALGSTLIRPASHAIPWADLLLLLGLVAVALVMGRLADHAGKLAEPSHGWLTIAIRTEPARRPARKPAAGIFGPPHVLS